MAVTVFIHPLDVSDEIHAVLAVIVEPADKWRYIDRLFRSPGCGIHCSRLLLRETQRHVDPNALLDRYLCGSQTLVRTRVLDVGIWNPGEHFLALGKHLLGCRIEIRKHFDGNPSLSYERRNALDNL